jgi:hypothetical protein
MPAQPPILAEAYASVALAVHGIFHMERVYHFLMKRAWDVVKNYKQKQKNEKKGKSAKSSSSASGTTTPPGSSSGSDDSEDEKLNPSVGWLLMCSSYDTLCRGHISEAEEQISRCCEIYLKRGNISLWFEGQFAIVYTHVLRGEYFVAQQLLSCIPDGPIQDPLIRWWKGALTLCCKVSWI